MHEAHLFVLSRQQRVLIPEEGQLLTVLFLLNLLIGQLCILLMQVRLQVFDVTLQWTDCRELSLLLMEVGQL